MFIPLLVFLLFQTVITLAAEPIKFKSTGNPIFADGAFYSCDPAPLVVNNTLYIIAGLDQAPGNVNSFIINEWQMFVADSPSPSGSDWTLYLGIITPKSVFKWAAPGTTYATQIV